MRGGIWASVFVCAGTALWSACAAEAASKAKPQITIETVKQAIEGKTGTVQLVTFPDTGWDAVKIVRGGSPARDKSGQKPATEKTETAEIVTFADPRRSPVRILRGDSERALAMPGQVRPAAMTMQVVTFASLRDRPVNILRGAGLPGTTEIELFGPASATDLASPLPSTAPNRATGPICACGARSREGRRDRCKSARRRPSMPAAATGSTSPKTVRSAAPTSPACIGATATGKTRSRPTIGARATSMPGLAADVRPTSSLWLSSATETGCCARRC